MTRLLVNKNIWVYDKWEGIEWPSGPFLVLSFKRFYPAGKTPRGLTRRLSLIEIYTDLGLRTLSVASVWSRDPSKNSNPW